MTGTITSLPPLVEQPPGNNSSNPAGLPGFTYTVAVLGIGQTWTALQTFPQGNISIHYQDVIGLTPSASVDTTNASNITSGTLPAARLPTPTASTLGGIQSIAAVSHNWISSISTSGVPSLSQPAFSDISGTVAASQLPTPTASTLGGVQSAAAVSHQWINSVSTAGVHVLSQPAFADISGNIAVSQMNSGTSASSSTFWRGDGTWANPAASAVSSFNARIGAVVPVAGDYTVALGGTGTTNLTGFYTGLQPLKLSAAVIAVNPGAWANAAGTATYNSTQVLSANLAVTNVDFTTNPATGAMSSGAMSVVGSTTDGADVQLYLIHRNSDGKVALTGSTSNVYAASQTGTITIASPGVITTPSAHGLFLNNTVYFTTTGALPTGLSVNTPYFVKTIPSATTFTVSATYGGTVINTSGSQSGTHTVKWGVQADLDNSLGAGIATVDRRVHFAFRWRWQWGGVNGGIPDFTADPRGDRVYLTFGGSAQFVLTVPSSGTATIATSIDCSGILSNLSRIAIVRVAVTSTGTAGTAYLYAPTAGASSRPVAEGATSGVTTTYAVVEVQTDSTGQIQYNVGGGAKLNGAWIEGWVFVDPS